MLAKDDGPPTACHWQCAPLQGQRMIWMQQSVPLMILPDAQERSSSYDPATPTERRLGAEVPHMLVRRVGAGPPALRVDRLGHMTDTSSLVLAGIAKADKATRAWVREMYARSLIVAARGSVCRTRSLR